MDACPSSFAWDDHDIHGTPFPEAVARHVDGCPRCRVAAERREASRQVFAARVAWPLRQRLATAPRRRWTLWPTSLIVAAAAAASLFAVIQLRRPDAGPYIGAKGDVAIELAGRRGGRVFPVDSDTIAEPGDELELTVRAAAGSPYVLVGSVDGTGWFSPFYPTTLDGHSLPVPAGGRPLEPPIVLDDAPGPERIVIVLSTAPVTVRDVAPWAEVGGQPPWRTGASKIGRDARHRPLGDAAKRERDPVILPGTALLPALLLTARIAIVSSSSQADGQMTLRYAERDAQRTAAVLRELGAFDAADVWLLPGTSGPALRDALDRAERRAAVEPGSTIVLYYSGHADPEGLLLGDERFTYLELRQRLASSKAQIRVAILDACNSGGATRTKGGRPSSGPPFAPVEPVRVQGAAILASSGAGELAQESNEIDGSFFTHHFISGLRGAGDRDGDGKVTLGEAYAYAYTRTIAATVSTLWGTQHPSYDYRLSGTGDLVLTTLTRERQAISFAPGAHDHYAVLNQAREAVAEVQSDPHLRPADVAARAIPHRPARARASVRRGRRPA